MALISSSVIYSVTLIYYFNSSYFLFSSSLWIIAYFLALFIPSSLFLISSSNALTLFFRLLISPWSWFAYFIFDSLNYFISPFNYDIFSSLLLFYSFNCLLNYVFYSLSWLYKFVLLELFYWYKVNSIKNCLRYFYNFTISEFRFYSLRTHYSNFYFNSF